MVMTVAANFYRMDSSKHCWLVNYQKQAKISIKIRKDGKDLKAREKLSDYRAKDYTSPWWKT